MDQGRSLAWSGGVLAKRERRDGERLTVTNGAFAETKQVVGGFALLQANSKEEAIEVS